MSKSWNRLETWLGLVVVAVGGVLAAIAGLHVYVTATATPLHPVPQGVPYTSYADTPAIAAKVADVFVRRHARTAPR